MYKGEETCVVVVFVAPARSRHGRPAVGGVTRDRILLVEMSFFGLTGLYAAGTIEA
jgi:hypothetical protein